MDNIRAPWETKTIAPWEKSLSPKTTPPEIAPSPFLQHLQNQAMLSRGDQGSYTPVDAARAFGKGLLNAPAAFTSGTAKALGSLEPVGSPWRLKFDQAAQNVQEWNWNQPWSPQFEPIAHEEFSEHPFVKTAWNVGNAIPQMAGAFAITAATGNPFLGSGIALGLPIFGDFYDQGIQRGLSHEKAFSLAATSAIGQTVLEGMVLKGLFAGGSRFNLMARGMITEGIEEGSQGLLENSLALVGWGGEEGKTLAENLTDGLLESMVAGAVLGGAMGSVAPKTIDDVKHDMRVRARSIIKEEAQKRSLSQDKIQGAEKAVDNFIDTFAQIPNLERVLDKLTQGLVESKDPMISGLVEVTSALGTSQYINTLPLHSVEVQTKAREMAMKMVGPKKWKNYPTVVQNMITQVHADALAQGLTEAEIIANAPDIVAEEVMQPNAVYIYSGGKFAATATEDQKQETQEAKDLLVWSPLFGERELNIGVGFLKNPTQKQLEVPKLTNEKEARDFGDDYRGDAFAIRGLEQLIESRKTSFDDATSKAKVAEIQKEIKLLEIALEQASSGGVFNYAESQTSIPPTLMRVAFTQENLAPKDKDRPALTDMVYRTIRQLYAAAPGTEILPPEYNEAVIDAEIKKIKSAYIKKPRTKKVLGSQWKGLSEGGAAPGGGMSALLPTDSSVLTPQTPTPNVPAPANLLNTFFAPKGDAPASPAPKDSVIPDFKSTEEAQAFALQATPQQTEELMRLYKKTLNEARKLNRDDATDAELQQGMELATKAQFYREAIGKPRSLVQGDEGFRAPDHGPRFTEPYPGFTGKDLDPFDLINNLLTKKQRRIPQYQDGVYQILQDSVVAGQTFEKNILEANDIIEEIAAEQAEARRLKVTYSASENPRYPRLKEIRKMVRAHQTKKPIQGVAIVKDGVIVSVSAGVSTDIVGQPMQYFVGDAVEISQSPQEAQRAMDILNAQKAKVEELAQAKEPLTFPEYITQVIQGKSYLTHDEYADALRALKKTNTPESGLLYDLLLKKYVDQNGESDVQKMFAEIAGVDFVADTEVLVEETYQEQDDATDTDIEEDVDQEFVDITEESELSDVDDNSAEMRDDSGEAEVTRFEKGRTISSLEKEILVEIATLLSDWRAQLEVIALSETKGKKLLVRDVKSKTRDIKISTTSEVKESAGRANKTLTESVNDTYRVLLKEAIDNLPKTLQDKINGTETEPGMSIDDLFAFIKQGGILDDADVNAIMEQGEADLIAGKEPQMIEFPEPLTIKIFKGTYKGQVFKDETLVVLQGPYSFTSVDGRVRLRDGIDVYVDPMDLANYIREQSGPSKRIKITNLTKRLSKKLKSKGGFWAPFGRGQSQDQNQEQEQSRYEQKSPFADEDAGAPINEPELNPDDPREHRLSEFLRSMQFSDTKGSLLKAFPDFFGEQAIKKHDAIQKVRAVDENFHEEIMNQVMADKRFMAMANFVARAQIRPLANRMWDIADELALDPEFMQAHGITKPNDKAFRQKIFDKLDRMMFRASEEIFSVEGKPNVYSLTQLGMGGTHEFGTKRDEGEAEPYVKDMVEYHDFFKIPFTPDDVSRWQIARDPLSFFSLAGRVNPGLKNVVSYAKAMYENPLMMMTLREGIFHNADMWGNIYRGYSRRVFQHKTGVQSGREKGPQRTPASLHTPAAKFRSVSEFVEEAAREGLEPIDRFTTSTIDYTTHTLALLQQWKSLNWFKSLRLKDHPKMEGVDPAILSNLKYVEYEDSPTIIQIAEKTKLEANDVLEKLGYAYNHSAPGFAEFRSNSFRKPAVYASLDNIIKSLNVQSTDVGEALNNANQVLAFAKRVVTVNPFDSAFIFMSGVMMNTPVMQWFTDIFPSFGKAMIRQGNLFSQKSIGKAILDGKYWGVLEESEMEHFDNLALFIRHGWTAYSHASYLKSIYDKNELGGLPMMETPASNVSEFIASVGGTNAAIFEHFIARKVYGVTDKIYRQFLDKGWSKDDAARRAVKVMNDFSFMLDPNIWGPEGKLLSLTFFTRNIAAGTIRQMSGALWPLLKMTPMRKLYSQSSSRVMTEKGRKWPLNKFFQAFFHGEATPSDLDVLATYYQTHIAKVMVASMLINSALQYILSFWDDDKEDEHGQIASMEPNGTLIKKRYMIFNEPNKRFAIRLPGDRDLNQRRLYIETQFMREAKHMASMMGALSEKWTPLEVAGSQAQWFKNRLNAPLIVILDLLQNRNATTQGNIYDPRIDAEYNAQAIANYIAQSMVPLAVFLREEERVFWGDKRDLSLAALQPLGFAVRRGTAAEAGTRVDDVRKSIRNQRLVDFARSQDERYFKTEKELRERGVDPLFTKETKRAAIMRKRFPGRQELKRDLKTQRQIDFFKTKGK